MNNISIYNKLPAPVNFAKSEVQPVNSNLTEVQPRPKSVNIVKLARKLAGWSDSRIRAAERLGDKITCSDHNSYCKQDCNNSMKYPKNKKEFCINECKNELTSCKDNPDKLPAEMAAMDVYKKYMLICNQMNYNCNKDCNTQYYYNRKVCNDKCTTQFKECDIEARKIIQ